jgi:hypothetical protein
MSLGRPGFERGLPKHSPKDVCGSYFGGAAGGESILRDEDTQYITAKAGKPKRLADDGDAAPGARDVRMHGRRACEREAAAGRERGHALE